MEISAVFDKYARYYNLFNSKKPYNQEIPFVYQWAKRPKTILDIGCGTGSYWKFYPNNVLLFGVEKSQAMVDNATSIGEIVHGDIQNLKIHSEFDCATALFHVINYIPKHGWWKNLPIKKGGYFIFDILDIKKVEQDGFTQTIRKVNGIIRRITPVELRAGHVDLRVEIFDREKIYQEKHRMYLYSHEDIESFCGKEFKIAEVKETDKWPTWYKLKRK